jgi:large subunit ribosomal protein L2
MSLKYYKPTTPSFRHKVRINYIKDEIWRGRPLKALGKGFLKANGRNKGLISSYHKERGTKKLYRQIDFHRRILDIPGIVKRVEYDPNRSSYISLMVYPTGAINYCLTTEGVKAGDILKASRTSLIDIKLGNSLSLKDIPIGTKVHNIETSPGAGGSLARAAGSFAKIIKIENGKVNLRLRSKKEITVSEFCLATIGVSSKSDYKNIKGGSAGYSRHLGRRPTVRGVAMNPIDHPHGGGEGKTSGGRISVTPWSRPTKGYKTKRKYQRK